MIVEVKINGENKAVDVPLETSLWKFIKEYLHITTYETTVVVDDKPFNASVIPAVNVNGSRLETAEVYYSDPGSVGWQYSKYNEQLNS
jgi:aerobic-type carbon monoxide dehydrogenase small subunit (CoxS/CutS family)